MSAASDIFDVARLGRSRGELAGWVPWRGTLLAMRARAEAVQFTADGERARSALARAAKPSPPAYE